MAYSYIQLPGDGSTTNFPFTFGYLSRDHVHVRVDGVEVPYTWVDTFIVQVVPAPGPGTIVEIRRNTPLDQPAVDWVDGSVLTEQDMDLDTIFNLYANQEARDIADSSLQLDSEGVWDGRGRTTINFADPIDDTSLVTRGYFSNVYTPQLEALVDEAEEARDQSRNARDAAQGYAAAADDSADAAAALLGMFRGQYLGASDTPPTVDGNGQPLTDGDLYFDTALAEMRVYSSTTGWKAVGSTIDGVIKFPPGNEPIIVQGDETDEIPVLGGYDAPYILVYVNGAQVSSPAIDVSGGSSILFAEPLEDGDEVFYAAFGAFRVADFYSKAEADARFYTKDEVDETFYTKDEVDENFYTKDESDGRFLINGLSVFGAVGDGQTDDTAALQAALNSDMGVLDGEGKTYRISQELVCSKPKVIRNLILTGQVPNTRAALRLAGSAGASVSVSANIARGATSITVANGSAFQKDQWVRLSSTAEYSSAGTRGEMVRVRSISGNNLTLHWPTALPYTAATTVAVPCGMVDGVSLIDVQIKGSLETDNQIGLRAFMVDKLFVSNLNSSDCDYGHVLLEACTRVNVQGGSAERTGATEGLDYGIVVANSCYDVKIYGYSGNGTRHVVTIGGSQGVNRHVYAYGCYADGCLEAGFDSHPQCIEHGFIGCSVEYAPGATGDGIISQGADFTCRDSRIKNPSRHGILFQPIVSLSDQPVFADIEGGRVVHEADGGTSVVTITTQLTSSRILYAKVSSIYGRGFERGLDVLIPAGGLVDFVTAQNNHFEDVRARGIYVQGNGGTCGSSSVSFNRIRMTSAATYGVFLQAVNGGSVLNTGLSGNVISGTSGTGLRAFGCNWVNTDGTNRWAAATPTTIDGGTTNANIREV